MILPDPLGLDKPSLDQILSLYLDREQDREGNTINVELNIERLYETLAALKTIDYTNFSHILTTDELLPLALENYNTRNDPFKNFKNTYNLEQNGLIDSRDMEKFIFLGKIINGREILYGKNNPQLFSSMSNEQFFDLTLRRIPDVQTSTVEEYFEALNSDIVKDKMSFEHYYISRNGGMKTDKVGNEIVDIVRNYSLE